MNSSIINITEKVFGGVHKEDNSDNAVLNVSDSTIAVTSETINKSGDGTQTTDFSHVDVTYRPVSRDKITVSDDSISHMTTPQDAGDEITLNTDVKGFVTYRTDNNDEMKLGDSVLGFVVGRPSSQFKNAMLTGVGTTEKTLYQCKSSEATIIGFCICNMKTSEVKVKIIRDSSERNVSIPPHTNFVLNNKESLDTNDEIKIVTDTPDSCDVFMSLLEGN